MRKIGLFGLVLAAALAFGCGAGATDQDNAGGGDGGSGAVSDSGDTKDTKGGDDKGEDKTAKVGDPARDGKFEFTVQRVKCGVHKVGTDLLGTTAQGQFCLVTVKVKNIAKEPQSFSDSYQKAYAADGTEYTSDSEAAIYANKDAATLFNEINPGNGITGVLVFDIPEKAKLAKLELHDSMFSGGVTVQLS
ncbi:DUF4352 domain-containing protein [Plantactinospora sp. B5E13]|uniref:DUF4352 domain-containing protein n=1 Tax=Plantactinospora sp. B5E13 TaxID=3153758 RepID=UPI00325E5B03